MTDAETGAVVPNATLLLNSPYGPLTEQSVRVTSIPDGPFAGPCDCYRLLLLAGQSQLVVQAVGFSEVEHVFYPVFPPDQSAQKVLGWLRGRV